MTQRLEYIDALRGFTMILVVLAHIINLGYHITDAKMEAMETFNNLFVRFRMPLFFFISGFVLYKHDRIWNNPTIKNFIKTKFLVQIVPTTVFFLLFCFLNGRNYVDHLGNMKAGYWFTIALFEFFVLYCFSVLFTNGSKNDATIIGIAFILYILASLYRFYQLKGEEIWIFDFLGIIHWRFYLFFILGTLFKKHFDLFCRCMDNQYLSAAIIVSMIIINVIISRFFPIHTYNTITFLFQGTLGIMIVFSFFKHYQESFKKEHLLGKGLQYIGRRTLDIYLLHYFFLPRNLEYLGQVFICQQNPVIEFFVSLSLALSVIIICLVVSNIIRLSPFLAHYLFGVKRINQ